MGCVGRMKCCDASLDLTASYLKEKTPDIWEREI